MKKNYATILTSAVLAATLLAGCGQSGAPESKGETQGNPAAVESGSQGAAQSVEFDFWSAPVPQQQAFWEKMAAEYMAVHPNVKIQVSAMPESPSSEAGIQSAIAGQTAPVMSENVFRGFAAQLAENQAIVPLNNFEGFEEIIAAREMGTIMDSWKLSDGNQYVMPVFSNPSMMLWRLDILKELGYDAPPETYSEMIAVGKAFKEKYPEKFLWVNADFINNSWYKRWWDFYTVYNAASEGNAFINHGELVADDKSAIATFNFFKELYDNDLILTQKATDPFEVGMSMCTQFVPFRFKAMREKFPELKYDEQLIVGAVPVPDGVSTENVKTIADSKGLVIYAQAPPEKQQAAFEFMKWVYSDVNHDVTWLEMTNLIPATGKIATDTSFEASMAEFPELVIFADNVKNAVPAMDSSLYVDVQTAIGDLGLIPIVNGQTDGETAWSAVKEEINKILQK